jgi:hypothetical protein
MVWPTSSHEQRFHMQYHQSCFVAEINPCLALLVQPGVHEVSILHSVTFIQQYVVGSNCLFVVYAAWTVHVTHHKRPVLVDIA